MATTAGLRASVITISDSSFRGEREDLSGPNVRAVLERLGWTVQCEIAPDDVAFIQRRLTEVCDRDQVDAIFTTGGTGVAPRDVTPEATRGVIEREIPGLGEWMRAAGREKTKYSILSRGVSGIRGRTLIINLPGSPKGATESLNAIVAVIPHTIDLIQGRTEHATGETAP